ncbi:MAG: zinc-binding dehydrogenase [Pseudomonadota bacterium]
MRAAVCRVHGGPLSLEPLNLADPAPNQVAVRIEACAICHSDLLWMSGGWGGTLPAVFGHEAAGRVEAVGEGVSDLAPGDAVIVTMLRSCGSCPCCARGLRGVCEAPPLVDAPLRDAAGAPVLQGLKTAAFAERALLDRSQLVRLDNPLAPELGALLACGGVTGYGAVANTAEFGTRDRAGAAVAVIGAGGVGLHAVQAAALFGADPVIAVDVSLEQLAHAEACGATHGLLAGPDLPDRMRALTGGRGVDFVFVSVGAPAAIQQSLLLLAPGGWSVIMGMPPIGTEIRLDPLELAAAQHRLIGSKLGDADPEADLTRLVDLHRSGRWRLEELIGARLPFDDVNPAIDAAKAGGLRTVLMF